MRRTKRPRAPSSASSDAPLSAGSETRSPPAVCGSQPSVTSSSATPPATFTCAAAKSRFRRSPPVLSPARATSRAPSRAGQSIRLEHEPHAAALRRLVRVAEQPEAGDVGHGVRPERAEDVGPVAVQRRHPLDGGAHVARRRQARAGRRAARARCRAASSGRARRPAGRRTSARSRRGGPCRPPRARTSAPGRGSCARRRGSRPPRAPACRRRRGSQRPSPAGSSSGNSAIDRASSGRPPIANTSLRAFVAAIVPKSRGSSTSGGKKSSVKTSAVLVVEPVDGGVVRRREPDEQILRLDGHEAGQQLLEPGGRVLGRAAAGGDELGQLHGHAWMVGTAPTGLSLRR